MLPTHPICITRMKTIIFWGVDTSELRFGGVRNSSSSWKLILELSSLNHTMHYIGHKSNVQKEPSTTCRVCVRVSHLILAH